MSTFSYSRPSVYEVKCGDNTYLRIDAHRWFFCKEPLSLETARSLETMFQEARTADTVLNQQLVEIERRILRWTSRISWISIVPTFVVSGYLDHISWDPLVWLFPGVVYILILGVGYVSSLVVRQSARER